MTEKTAEQAERLRGLCGAVRKLVRMGDFQKCRELIGSAMGAYPDAPEPHNLLGIVLEKEGNHPEAMKHFRAAWDLDSTYAPARQNLDFYGTFCAKGRCAYDESDCASPERTRYDMKFDKNGIGYMVRRELK
ncbi:MAG: hypothetical protein ACI4P4_02295 [Faecousia sp.]